MLKTGIVLIIFAAVTIFMAYLNTMFPALDGAMVWFYGATGIVGGVFALMLLIKLVGEIFAAGAKAKKNRRNEHEGN